MTNRIYGVVVIVAVFFGCLGFLIGDYPAKASNLRVEEIKKQLKVAQEDVAALKARLKAADQNGDKSSLVKRLKEQGIESPNVLIEDLQKHPELIPQQPVLGGTFFFTQIEILSTQWVYASYEDGHTSGEALFKYSINPDGSIRWTPVSSSKE